jgi:hypothetical protein
VGLGANYSSCCDSELVLFPSFAPVKSTALRVIHPDLCIDNAYFKRDLRDKIAKGFIDYVLFGELM